MAKDSRFKFEYRANASKLHKAVGEVLRGDTTFSNHEIYQEYPVNRINTKYENGSHHFDWVIPGLKVVIECHGKQHYQVVAFDGDMDKAVDAFKELKTRDKAKKEACLDAGFVYIEIPYKLEKKVSASTIMSLFEKGQAELEAYDLEHAARRKQEEEQEKRELVEILKEKKAEEDKKRRQKHLTSKRHIDTLKKARQFRQKKYRQLKEFKNK